MKKLFCLSIASILVLSGCASSDNELINAIDQSYDLDTGTIVSDFKYTTAYDNIDLAGTIDGKIKIQFGDDLDKISANVNFGDKADKFEYYVNNKGEVISDTENTDVKYSPLYIDAPELGDYEEKIPEPTPTTIKVNKKDVKVNQYTFEMDKMNTDVAKSMFDPIIKLGFVSSDVLKNDVVNGTFKLNYYVNPETGQLIRETLEFSNKADNTISTKNTVSITNNYSYDEVTVEMPAESSETGSEAASE